MRLLAVLLLVGCHTSYVRYVGTAASPDETRMVVAIRARAVGWKREKRRPASSLIELGEVAHPETLRDDPVPSVGSRADSSRRDMRADGSSPVDASKADMRVAIADTTPPDSNQADVPSGPDLSPDGVDVYRTFDGKPTVTARAMPFGSGSLLEVSSKSVAMIDRVSSGGDTYEAKDQKWSLDVFHVDTTIDVGYARSMHTDFRGRADWMVHLGHALWARGGDAAVVETRKRISLVGGVGLTVTDRPAVRPEVGVMFDMQDALKPFGDRIYQSRRKSLSFSVAIARARVRRARRRRDDPHPTVWRRVRARRLRVGRRQARPDVHGRCAARHGADRGRGHGGGAVRPRRGREGEGLEHRLPPGMPGSMTQDRGQLVDERHGAGVVVGSERDEP